MEPMKHLISTLLCGAMLISGPVFAAEKAPAPPDATPAATPAPTPAPTPAAAEAETGYWLSATGKRHNSKCRYYKKTKGIPCKAGDGTACKACGG